MIRYKIRILKTADRDLDEMLSVMAEYGETVALRKYDKKSWIASQG